MKQFVLFSILSVCSLVVVSQPPEPRRFNFTHYTEETGLISYQINSTVQDEDGYIWIASNEGLQRYDGIRHKSFYHSENDSLSIPSKSILQILLDSQKRMWLLFDDGQVGVFNTRDFRFREATVHSKYTAPYSTLLLKQRLIADEYGQVFLLMVGKTLLTYDKVRNEFTDTHNFFEIKPGWELMDFVQQPGTKKYWLSLGEGGFAVYNGTTGQLSYSGNNLEQEKLIELYRQTANPTALFFDSHGRLWHTGTDNGLPYISAYDPKNETVVLDHYGFSEQVPQYHEINNFMEQHDGSIWITGINIFASYLESEKEFQQVLNGYVNEQSIDYVVITSITEDREHNIWISTGNNGLYRFNPAEEFFLTIEHPSKLKGNIGSGAPLTFIEDQDGSILVGVWGDGLYRYDKEFKQLPLDIRGYPQDRVSPILELTQSGRGNYIWMAAAFGLYKYDQEKRTAVFYNFPELKSRIRTVKEDRNGILWLGLQEHGVYKWDPSKGESSISRFPAITAGRIHSIMVDRAGLVWVATFGSGAYVVDPETGQVLQHFHANAPVGTRLPERYVSSFLDYNDSLVVMATKTNIMLYNRTQHNLTRIAASANVTGIIQAMERDTDGYIWFSTSTGLHRLTPAKRLIIKFNRKDGILNDYFIISSSYTLPDGSMLFGATASIVAFNPGDIHINTSYPVVHLTDFKVMNRSLPVDSILALRNIKLPANKSSISIDLSTLSYNTAYAVRYILEGLDTDWRTADRSYQLTYSYLPPGDYTLMAVPINSEGIEGSNLLSLDIAIAPPFWRTWWFLSLLTVFCVAVLYFLDRVRMQRKESEQKMRTEIATNLHQEVNTALNNINILSEMASRKAKSDPEKSTQFIEQIHSKSHNMIIAMDDMLWSLAPENDNMEKTVERMKEYIDALNNRHNSGIEMLVDKRVQSLKLNMQFRYEAFTLFKENIKALVQASARKCIIHLTIEKAHLLYTIEYNNECCDIQALNHLQERQDMNNRMNQINAKLKVRVLQNHSFIELKIPIVQ